MVYFHLVMENDKKPAKERVPEKGEVIRELINYRIEGTGMPNSFRAIRTGPESVTIIRRRLGLDTGVRSYRDKVIILRERNKSSYGDK